MKTIFKYRAYLRAVLFSIIAAFIIDALINFDDFKRNFDQGRGKVTFIIHPSGDTIFKVPEHVAVITGILYRTIFE